MSQQTSLPMDARHAQALPDYASLAQFLLESGAYLEACELHGMLCGFICAGSVAPNATWLNLLLISATDEYRSEVEALVNQLFRCSLEQLSSFSFDFEVLLPTAESPNTLLPISKLSQWCESFLLALNVAEPKKGKNTARKATDKGMDKEIDEAKEDIKKVSRVYYQVLQCNEPFDDEAFSALLEHVRVSVMLIFTEQNGRIRPTQH